MQQTIFTNAFLSHKFTLEQHPKHYIDVQAYSNKKLLAIVRYQLLL